MVPLKDLFSLLASGEFSNIAITKDSRGSIDESEYGKLINHINLAIIELHKRFNFFEEEIVLCADPAVELYYLRPDYMAKPGATSLTRYIEQPAGNTGSLNIIEIKDVYDELGNKIALNNRFSVPHIKQKALDTLRITGLEVPQKLSIVFQSYPDPVQLNDSFSVDSVLLNIPPTVVEAILYYVAARVYKPMGANSSADASDKSASYQHQYELSCQKLALYGLSADDNDRDDERFVKQGWA